MGLLPSLVNWGLDGIEYIHHTQTPERRDAVAEAAERYGLFLTGGTDFHGMYSEKTLCPGGLAVLMEEGHAVFNDCSNDLYVCDLWSK
jgi:hypothetical protein